MTLLRCLMLAIVCASPGAPAFAAPDVPDSVAVGVSEIDAASDYYRIPRRYKLDRMTERLPDGVKGVVYTPHVEPPPAVPGGDRYLAPLWWHGCHALVFGEVELVGKTAFAGRDGLGIFTKLRFKVVEDWRPGEHHAPATVYLTLPGGELNYNGEAFRFENTLGHYQLHARYVLLAGERTTREGDAVMGQPPYLDIADGLIYPGPGWTPFARGTSLIQAKADVARAMSSAPCAR